jgi:hypothetical protein
LPSFKILQLKAFYTLAQSGIYLPKIDIFLKAHLHDHKHRIKAYLAHKDKTTEPDTYVLTKTYRHQYAYEEISCNF